MSKPGVIFPLCFLILSGCALTESPEIIADKAEIVNPVTQSQTVSASPPIVEPVEAIEPPPAPRMFSVDEIRRLQTTLRDVGLDPGPADGIPGGKTRSAVEQLQSGCTKITALLDNYAAIVAPDSNKLPSRQHTLALQSDLRKAGFNPGPADGILGARTKTVVGQLHAHCPMAQEYAISFNSRNPNVMAKPAASGEASARPTKLPAVATSGREETVKTVSAAPPTASQEDIRILQLRLRDAGFDPGPFDGVMGPKTLQALQEFEAAQRAGKIKAPLAAGISVQY